MKSGKQSRIGFPTDLGAISVTSASKMKPFGRPFTVATLPTTKIMNTHTRYRTVAFALAALHSISSAALLAQVFEGDTATAMRTGQTRARDGVLVFQDEFDRNESQEEKDEPGNEWTTSSDKTAGGHKQVDLRDGAMHIFTHASANHATSVRNHMQFTDGTVQIRFQLHEPGDSLKLNFADMNCKTVHAGHLFNVIVSGDELTFVDRKTGAMDLEIWKARKANRLTDEQHAMLLTKTRQFPANVPYDQWHEIEVNIRGDKVSAEIDGRHVGSFRSPGIAHPSKTLLRLLVEQTATVDDLRIWRYVSGEQIFHDDFERQESQELAEDLGNGWRTNSENRAAGKKQADLRAGTLYIRTHDSSKVKALVFHEAGFEDGTVAFRFKLENPEDTFGLILADPEISDRVHFGFLSSVWIGERELKVTDMITGSMDPDIRKKRQSKELTPELRALIDSKTKRTSISAEAGKWHEAVVDICRSTCSVAIDGIEVCRFFI